MISIIVAIAENYAIGKDNDLLWHIPADMKRFKALTLGHPVIMGKKTWLSLPKRPLPGRKNIIITDDPSDCFEGCIMVHTIDEALAQVVPGEESFVIGGASVYKQFYSLAGKLSLTIVNKEFKGDVFFPEIDFSEWQQISAEDIAFDEALGFSYSNKIFVRKPCPESH